MEMPRGTGKNLMIPRMDNPPSKPDPIEFYLSPLQWYCVVATLFALFTFAFGLVGLLVSWLT